MTGTGTPAAIEPDAIVARFRKDGFVCPAEVATTLFLADTLKRPVLLEGPPGVGKTEIAKRWAALHEAELVRLQCYEGLDESKALYEWAYGKQMLFAQLLRDRVSELLSDAASVGDALERLRGQAEPFFSRDFLLERPLLRAVTRADRVVLLVDEVDRADEEFEAYLLEVLSDAQVSIPEIGTVSGPVPPRAVLTSNHTRELSGALRRRCLYAYVDYPDADDEAEILRARVPGVGEALAARIVRFVHSVRRSDVRRAPGIAESIDWALALVAVGVATEGALPTDAVRRTLGALLKDRDDVELVMSELARHRS